MNALTALPETFASKVVVQSDGCWRWSGAVQSKGYGAYFTLSRTVLAHRHILTLVGRPVPVGLCVDHLEAVTNAENARRRGASVTHCVAGHRYTADNTRRNGQGHRHCKTCERSRREAGHIGVALAAGFVIAFALYGVVVGISWLIVWLAGTDLIHAQAYAFTVLVLLGAVGFAGCAVRDRVLDARNRRDERLARRASVLARL